MAEPGKGAQGRDIVEGDAGPLDDVGLFEVGLLPVVPGILEPGF